ncbi:MAG: hypothetical protein ACREIA_16100 [Opitutaceae bacterium]
MKFPPPPGVLGLFSVLLCLAGCASSPMSRIDADRALYESWPVDMRQAVLDQRIVKGMTPEMVKMTLGEPKRVESRPGRGGAIEEIWIYGGPSDSPLRNTSIGIGVGPVGIGGIGGGSGGSYADYREVVFVGGVVASGDDPK